jgi:hypothetical protein
MGPSDVVQALSTNKNILGLITNKIKTKRKQVGLLGRLQNWSQQYSKGT